MIGGVGNVSVLRAGTVHNGRYEISPGGDVVHFFSIGDHSCQPQIPASANNLARRIPTPLFGAGLIEALSDSAIRTWEDPDDRNHDGIRGRAALVMDPATHTMQVGRFGWKAQQATLLAFTAEALRNEMGITNDLFPNEIGTGLSTEQLAACDAVPDPEDKADPEAHLRGIDQLALFTRFLAPVTPLPQTESMHRGLELFSRIDCAACHVPELHTGSNENPALDNKAVNAYSDFLLHDIGTGDGVEQGAAKGNEFRTSPLWGLRFRKLLMHDGSALNPTEAIKQHRGEADRSSQMFDVLSESDRQALLDFLSSL
ncbi:MAG TPA: di-heme oxidoredictase family protein [Bryobacteraceae bacterium]|nr:di-heme oxidoredictase family protein [Bryobacteraceae bacterium]